MLVGSELLFTAVVAVDVLVCRGFMVISGVLDPQEEGITSLVCVADECLCVEV